MTNAAHRGMPLTSSTGDREGRPYRRATARVRTYYAEAALVIARLDKGFRAVALRWAVVLLIILPSPLIDRAVAQDVQRYRVGVCDWMVLKRQKIGEFQLAKDLGCDGIEMDMGGLGARDSFDNKMRVPASVSAFRHKADSLGITIGAIAMSGFYGQSFATKSSYRWLVQDCIDTMEKMGARVAFLPLGGCGNGWTDSLELRREVVRRLHEVGEMAAARSVTIGIDTPLDAEGNLQLLREIDSRGIGIFYKLQTAVERGLNICADLQVLGAENICAIHATNTDGLLLRDDPAIDMPAVRQTLDTMGWGGWLFVERSRDANDVHNVKRNYGENVKYLKEVFQ